MRWLQHRKDYLEIAQNITRYVRKYPFLIYMKAAYISMAWFHLYCGSRTLANTLEASLFCIALSFWPLLPSDVTSLKVRNLHTFKWMNLRLSLMIAAVTCYMRPTAVLLFIPLTLLLMLSLDLRTNLKLLINALICG